jgi:hypothetical protein
VSLEGFGGSVSFSRVSSNASSPDNNIVGNAGDIRITTGTLLLKDGGSITAFNGGHATYLAILRFYSYFRHADYN